MGQNPSDPRVKWKVLNACVARGRVRVGPAGAFKKEAGRENAQPASFLKAVILRVDSDSVSTARASWLAALAPQHDAPGHEGRRRYPAFASSFAAFLAVTT